MNNFSDRELRTFRIAKNLWLIGFFFSLIFFILMIFYMNKWSDTTQFLINTNNISTQELFVIVKKLLRCIVIFVCLNMLSFVRIYFLYKKIIKCLAR